MQKVAEIMNNYLLLFKEEDMVRTKCGRMHNFNKINQSI